MWLRNTCLRGLAPLGFSDHCETPASVWSGFRLVRLVRLIIPLVLVWIAVRVRLQLPDRTSPYVTGMRFEGEMCESGTAWKTVSSIGHKR